MNPEQKRKRNFTQDKKDLIDFAFQNIVPRPKSFADLGGVWNVDAGYTFYTLEKYPVASCYLVDTDFTVKVLKRSEKFKQLTLVKGNFGDQWLRDGLDKVDLIFLFDVLLHQVKPDWDEILEMYAPFTGAFLIFNPQHIKTEKTIRLLDLGREGYLENVPHSAHHPLYNELFEKLDQIHPQHQKPWRDIHNVWQWGINDRDLTAKMEKLGFSLILSRNCGRFQKLENFESHAFLFQKDGQIGKADNSNQSDTRKRSI